MPSAIWVIRSKFPAATPVDFVAPQDAIVHRWNQYRIEVKHNVIGVALNGTSTARYTIPQRIVHDVRQVIPPDGIVALDNGVYKVWFARNYRISVANTLLLDNARATMGAGLLRRSRPG